MLIMNRLDLLREFVSELLIDQATFMSWLSSIMLSSNIPQLEFVIRIAEEHFEGVMENRAFLAPYVEACLIRITEVCDCGYIIPSCCLLI